MKAQWLTPVLCVIACGQPTSIPGPTVSVLRQTGTSCFQQLSTAAPSSDLGVKLCDQPAATNNLFAGIDVLELVIDYGTVDFPLTATIPAPAPVILVNDVPSKVVVTTIAQPRTNGHTFFLATFTAPNTLSPDVRISVPVSAGYATDDPSVYVTIDPPILVSTLKKTSAACFSLLDGPAPATELGLVAPCDTDSSMTLDAAVDLVELVVDYGILDIPSSVVIPSPTVTTTVDGAQIGAPLTGLGQRQHGGHDFFVVTLHAPPAVSQDVHLDVRTSANPLPTPTGTFTTVVATPVLTIAQCPATGECDVTGAVGSIEATVTVPGDVGQSIAFHNIVDQSLFDPVGPQSTAGGPPTSAVVTLPVPAAQPGSTWTLEAQLGTAVVTRELTIQKPQISATLSCSSPCSLAVGAAVGLTVTAPKTIHVPQAVYSTRLNGVPVLTGATLDLTTVDNTTETVSGIATITAALVGTLQIDVSVNGYSATSLSIQVH